MISKQHSHLKLPWLKCCRYPTLREARTAGRNPSRRPRTHTLFPSLSLWLVSNPCVYHEREPMVSDRLKAGPDSLLKLFRSSQVSVWIVIRTFVQVSWNQMETFVTVWVFFLILKLKYIEHNSLKQSCNPKHQPWATWKSDATFAIGSMHQRCTSWVYNTNTVCTQKKPICLSPVSCQRRKFSSPNSVIHLLWR